MDPDFEPGGTAAAKSMGTALCGDGPRLHGLAVTRLNAVLAFAMTLLVISIDAIPKIIADLFEALKGSPEWLGRRIARSREIAGEGRIDAGS